MTDLNTLINYNLTLYSADQVFAIRAAIASYLTNEKNFEKIYKEIIIAAARYKTHSMHEHPEEIRGFGFRSDENREKLETALANLNGAKEFLQRYDIRCTMLKVGESLPFDKTDEVLSRAISLIEDNILHASKRGASAKNARDNLFTSLFSIWVKYIGLPVEITARGGKYSSCAQFIMTATSPVLHRNDSAAIESAVEAAGTRFRNEQKSA